MPKFRIYGIYTGAKYLGEFEAETREEAQEQAEMSVFNDVSLCHYCSDQLSLDDRVAGDFVVEEVKEGSPNA